jgi:alpha-ketoglutarate-dependent taurine dioxygenase
LNNNGLVSANTGIVAERGVVFFRKQDSLTNDLQKQFILKLGELTGRPESSTVHIHPILNSTNEFGVSDNEISTISSLHRKKRLEAKPERRRNTKNTEATWHSDIQFEEVPADYTSLRLTQLPKSGGDTLWASGQYQTLSNYSTNMA